MYGKERASLLCRQHRLSRPVDLRRLVEELGLEVVTFPFRGRVNEVIIGRVIGVRPGLERAWFRWHVAHAIGHHLLHVGSRSHSGSWSGIGTAKAERQAEEFAAWLLCGPEIGRRSATELLVPREKVMMARELASALGQRPATAG